MDEPTRKTVAPVLARIPSGIYIVTAADGGGRETGMLASWIQQAAFEPPMLTFGVNKSRYLVEWLKNSPQLAVSILGDEQTEFIAHFGRGFEPDAAAFDGINVARGLTGLPVLADAIGWLEGTVAGQIDAGDHIIYLLEITGAGGRDDILHEQPMVHIRKNGFHY